MSDGQVFLAKPSGVTLVDHTNHLRAQFRRHILPTHGFVAAKYLRLTGGNDLVPLTLRAIQWHDAGKKHPRWQGACQQDFAKLEAWRFGGMRGRRPVGVHLRSARLRHEFDSLQRLLFKEPDAPPVIQAAIAAHHGKLSRRHSDRWNEDDDGKFASYWAAFERLSNEIDGITDFDRAVLRRYEFSGPRSLLQLADHRASADEDGATLPAFTPFRYEFPAGWEKRGVQKVVERCWDEPLALLRAPTGAGKTDAALLWAKHQIESGRADRLVIAMPTRFTANSLAVTNAEKLSAVGLYHSSAWYQAITQQEEDRGLWVETEEMARLLETPITVTTIDHLCMSLTGAREDHHAILFNLAHSCLVIDEADFYDTFTQANLVILLRVLRLLDVPVLLMSATLPESARAFYSAPPIYEDTSESQRVRCHLTLHSQPAAVPSDVKGLLQPALNATPTIIYANTVLRAQKYYRWLLNHGMSADQVVLYHSRFTEPDKADIERRLTKMLGKDAWQAGVARGVAVLTQIGELSVNISADYMLSDLCPLDRLVQRVGRLARFSTEPGALHLLLPHKKNRQGELLPYPAPYGTYHRKVGWVPSPALERTAAMLTRTDYTAADFVALVNDLYADLPEMDSRTRENQHLLRQLIKLNWLILPGGTVTEDENAALVGTETWCCRDIDPQQTVLVGMGNYGMFGSEDALKNRREWRRKLLEHGVAVRQYELNRACDNGLISKVTFAIGEEERADHEEAWLANSEVYDKELGLCLQSIDDDAEEDDD